MNKCSYRNPQLNDEILVSKVQIKFYFVALRDLLDIFQFKKIPNLTLLQINSTSNLIRSVFFRFTRKLIQAGFFF